jgi:hypothetical protein
MTNLSIVILELAHGSPLYIIHQTKVVGVLAPDHSYFHHAGLFQHVQKATVHYWLGSSYLAKSILFSIILSNIIKQFYPEIFNNCST